MSDLDKGRALWRTRHAPAAGHDNDGTSSADHGHATASLAAGAALWERRKNGTAFDEPHHPGTDIAFGGDAA